MPAKRPDPSETSRSEISGSVQRELFGFLDTKAHQLARMDESGVTLLKEVRRLIEAGGSGIRPILCVTAYQVCRGTPTSGIYRVAASFELLHSFALIHDDLLDGATIRRGAPTTVKQHSVGTAVLAGDMAFALSDELYFASGLDAAGLVRAFRHLADARLKALTGQYLELSVSPSKDPTLPSKVARLKTSSYSLVGPMLAGADLAGASAPTLAALGDFGDTLGEAYQLRDDLRILARTSDKDVASDLRNGRPTALISAVLGLVDPGQEQEVLGLWGNPQATETDIDTFVEIAEKAGVRESMDERIRSLVSEAKDSLRTCSPAEVNQDAFAMLNDLADHLSTDGLDHLDQRKRALE